LCPEMRITLQPYNDTRRGEHRKYVNYLRYADKKYFSITLKHVKIVLLLPWEISINFFSM
jgi:hypothetical protein